MFRRESLPIKHIPKNLLLFCVFIRLRVVFVRYDTIFDTFFFPKKLINAIRYSYRTNRYRRYLLNLTIRYAKKNSKKALDTIDIRYMYRIGQTLIVRISS